MRSAPEHHRPPCGGAAGDHPHGPLTALRRDGALRDENRGNRRRGRGRRGHRRVRFLERHTGRHLGLHVRIRVENADAHLDDRLRAIGRRKNLAQPPL